MKKSLKLFQAVFVVIIAYLMVSAFFCVIKKINAGEPAFLMLYASQEVYEVGELVRVELAVQPQSEGVMVARVFVEYQPALLEPVSFELDGDFPYRSPGETLADGLISVGAFRLSSPLTTKGRIGTMVFKAKQHGNVSLSLSQQSLLINQQQENIISYQASGGTDFLIVEQAPVSSLETPEPVIPSAGPSPIIKSFTHSDPNQWYNLKNAVFTWNIAPGQRGYVYDVSRRAGDDPGDASFITEPQATVENLNDGVNYFNLKAKYDTGFSVVASYLVRVDTEPPLPFTIFVDSQTDDAGEVNYSLVFRAEDLTSNITEYFLQIDEELTGVRVVSPHVLRPEDLLSGKLVIKAVDAAGNYRLAELQTDELAAQLRATPYIETEAMRTPVIERVERVNKYRNPLWYQEALRFEGRAMPNTELTLILDSQTGLVSPVTVDRNGRWQAFNYMPLAPGTHSVYAEARFDETVSAPSRPLVFHLDDLFAASKSINRITVTALVVTAFASVGGVGYLLWHLHTHLLMDSRHYRRFHRFRGRKK